MKKHTYANDTLCSQTIPMQVLTTLGIPIELDFSDRTQVKSQFRNKSHKLNDQISKNVFLTKKKLQAAKISKNDIMHRGKNSCDFMVT